MGNIDLVEEKPLSLAEMKEKLEQMRKRDKELEARAQKTEEYLHRFVDEKKSKDLAKKLEGLGIARLRDRHIKKIMDLMPKDMDSLKMLFSGENLTLKQEDLDKIISVIK
ncbi:hypothetical protein J4426_02675 [Candidatus Woesearchaeota archaeon]|nr:hypothetical protein [Candidatus Woesearchaeota archaeon]